MAYGWIGSDGQIRDCIAPDTHEQEEGEYTVPLYAADAIEALQAERDEARLERRMLMDEDLKFQTMKAYQHELVKLREELAQCKSDAMRYRWMKQTVKRIPPGWGLVGWDAAIDRAMQESSDDQA